MSGLQSAIYVYDLHWVNIITLWSTYECSVDDFWRHVLCVVCGKVENMH